MDREQTYSSSRLISRESLNSLWEQVIGVGVDSWRNGKDGTMGCLGVLLVRIRVSLFSVFNGSDRGSEREGGLEPATPC